MIKTDNEYLQSKKRLEEEMASIEEHKKKMKESGIKDSQIKLAIDPLLSFSLQLKEEIEEYDKLKKGQFDPIENLYGIGRMLVAIRISKGLKQKDLAESLGVKESQISRDERNEYYGASIEKVQKVLEAMGVTLTSNVEKGLNKSA
ncbi:MAG: helix-turn-helix transcriptional regulator [Bdellovibrionota bacterium]